jgi:hypothetical protein
VRGALRRPLFIAAGDGAALVSKGKPRKQVASSTLITRSPGGARASEELETLLARSWDRMFPQFSNPEELSSTDRKNWIRHQRDLVRTFYEMAGAAQTIGEGFIELVEAEVGLASAKITDLNERRDVELGIEERNAHAKRGEKRAERTGREGREDKLLDQEIAERKRFMQLGTASFVATLFLLSVGIVTQQDVGYAGSGAGLLVSCGLWGFGVIRPLHKQRRREEERNRSRWRKRGGK